MLKITRPLRDQKSRNPSTSFLHCITCCLCLSFLLFFYYSWSSIEEEALIRSARRKRSSLHDIFDDGSDWETARARMNATNVTQVFRAETVAKPTPPKVATSKGDLLLNSIIRTSERNGKWLDEERKARENLKQLSLNLEKSHIDEVSFFQNNGHGNEPGETGSLCSKSSNNSTPTKSFGGARARSYSSNVTKADSVYDCHLDPLDLTFENEDECWVRGGDEDEEEDEELATIDPQVKGDPLNRGDR